jgi:peptide/nickel transport system substrate-binding protein
MRITLAMLGALAALPAAAQSLTIGAGAPITSLDPHFYNASPNTSMAMNLFGFLTTRDAHARLQPDLAESWTPVGEEAWEFTLRPGLAWTDGRPLTADDVAFTLARVPNVPNSPGGFQGNLVGIAGVDVVDARTLRIRTQGPAPLVPTNMASLAVIARHAAEGAATADFNSGKAAIGAGPFRLVSYAPGERVVLERNPGWHGAFDGKANPWQQATVRFITNDAARTAALLAGDIDVMDQVPSADVPRLAADPRVAVSKITGLRVIYLTFDYKSDGAPAGFTDGQGRPLAANPLRDVRVRRALSMAINRAAIADRIMAGLATPTAQWLPPGAFGNDPDLPAPAYDPEGARKLLAEALPQGLRVVLHTPNDRYPNDAQTAQAVAQFWTRAGVATQVEALPWATYSTRANRNEFGIHLIGWGSTTGEASSFLVNILATASRERRWGAVNRAGHSDPVLDALVAQGVATLDDEQREAIWRTAVRRVADQVSMLPLHQITNSWAARRGLSYEARADERTLAYRVFPAN